MFKQIIMLMIEKKSRKKSKEMKKRVNDKFGTEMEA